MNGGAHPTLDLTLLQPLAAAGVSVFALSTFDTDGVLAQEAALDDAVAALSGAGHRLAAIDVRDANGGSACGEP